MDNIFTIVYITVSVITIILMLFIFLKQIILIDTLKKIKTGLGIFLLFYFFLEIYLKKAKIIEGNHFYTLSLVLIGILMVYFRNKKI